MRPAALLPALTLSSILLLCGGAQAAPFTVIFEGIVSEVEGLPQIPLGSTVDGSLTVEASEILKESDEDISFFLVSDATVTLSPFAAAFRVTEADVVDPRQILIGQVKDLWIFQTWGVPCGSAVCAELGADEWQFTLAFHGTTGMAPFEDLSTDFPELAGPGGTAGILLYDSALKNLVVDLTSARVLVPEPMLLHLVGVSLGVLLAYRRHQQGRAPTRPTSPRPPKNHRVGSAQVQTFA